MSNIPSVNRPVSSTVVAAVAALRSNEKAAQHLQFITGQKLAAGEIQEEQARR
jgi:hypothetical protein